MRLPFDAHNHVHLGPTPPLVALQSALSGDPFLCGMALMSTHPRDYAKVAALTKSLPTKVPDARIIPCYGVHPWFLHELTERDWEPSSTDNGRPKWVQELDEWIVASPESTVGEIGLDKLRYDPVTRELVSSMDRQVVALQAQLEIASLRKRPVSLHNVQAWGPMMTVLSKLKTSTTGLPPRMYFHAFGGKAGTVDQLLALCGRESTYFGFAPVINFRSPKTVDVIRRIGLDRIVLETDHEDASRVHDSIENSIQFLAKVLQESTETVVEQTTANALELYRV